MPVVLLIDNGSTRPAATLKLREIAEALSRKIQYPVHAVSLQHADRIAPEDIQNRRADVFNTFIRDQLEQGNNSFLALPLFFGQSRALTSFIPQQLDQLKEAYGEIDFQLADVIYPLSTGEPLLSRIIYQNIQQCIDAKTTADRIVLVDHGSPIPDITEVRHRVAKDLQVLCQASVDEACMERRDGAEYDFNGMLLEDYLMRRAKAGDRTIIVALLFFLAGRHAGDNGDIQTICTNVQRKHPSLNIKITSLISDNSLIVDILSARYQASVSQ